MNLNGNNIENAYGSDRHPGPTFPFTRLTTVLRLDSLRPEVLDEPVVGVASAKSAVGTRILSLRSLRLPSGETGRTSILGVFRSGDSWY